MSRETIDKFIHDQLSQWPLACDNYRALKNVSLRELEVGGLRVKVQFNPARIISSAADTDRKALQKRPCFLCPENRPKEQMNLVFEGRKGKKYDILVNPFPIFPEHLVIALNAHTDQSIAGRYVDILDLSRTNTAYSFFYNGPHCGASAPDHHHFQACGRRLMPLEADVDALVAAIPRDKAGNYVYDPDREGPGTWSDTLKYLTSIQDAHLYHYDKFTRGIFVIRSRTVKSAAKMFYRLLDCADIQEGDTEPRFNLVTWYSRGEYKSIIIFRRCHRSHHYFADGPDHLVMSPGCADMCGFFITPRQEDFEKLDARLIGDMMDEVSFSKEQEKSVIEKLTRTQPLLSVGVLSAASIDFQIISDGAGRQRASYREGKIDYNGALYDELIFDAQTPSTMLAEPTFILYDVVIGVGFHWERKETQKFAGSLKIIVEKDHLVAVNIIGVEDYLLSVISSEMKSTSSEEFLKAHAVISRSWVMAQIESRQNKKHVPVPEGIDGTAALVTRLDMQFSGQETATEGEERHIVKWYDHDDHKLFDVCADDHCQRYQGLTRAVGDTVRRVIDATWGQVLRYDGKICDARFSKCCGGVMEVFSSCWADVDYPYLQALPDTPDHNPDGEVFCNTSDKAILSQVLNNYDRETPDFYRWEQGYDRQELSELVKTRSGIDVGNITALEPLTRGGSGRITALRIKGDKGSFVVGKELEIRKILSTSHLKSSDFDARFDGDKVVLEGRGWGHGVGLCQIGAAVMAAKGYRYTEILNHYYPGANVEK